MLEHFFKQVGRPLLVAGSLSLTACSSFFNYLGKDSIESTPELTSAALQQPVTISRDSYGVPLIEAQNLNDLSFGIGYSMAEDRLAQMVSMSLLAQGRLSEMVGGVAVDMDAFMRTLGLPQIIKDKVATTPPEIHTALEVFAQGVNAYIEEHKSDLPIEFTLSAYKPEPWQPRDSVAMFTILALGVGFNIHEELAFLHFAQKLGWEKAAYLAPVYQDEGIDFAEAEKIADLDLSGLQAQLGVLQQQESKLRKITATGVAASNNWGVHKSKTKNNQSIIANDTHLIMTQPALWNMIAVKSPQLSGAGIALAGLPALVAGYNGHIAWGETMVMADTMDVFLEKLRVNKDGVKEYLYKGQWYPVERREEKIKVNMGFDKTIIIETTRHGPLLDSLLSLTPRHQQLVTPKINQQRYGLALSWTAREQDKTTESFFALNQAKTMEEAKAAINGIGYIHLNIIYGDKDSIAWQVTGLYPQRKKGTGHFPSPGWDGDYDWMGMSSYKDLPYEKNPKQGYLYTANHKTVPADYPIRLSSSWYYPERSERIKEMLEETDQHTAASSVAMQADRKDLFAAKLQALLLRELPEIKKNISKLEAVQANAAKKTLEAVLNFDGEMAVDSWQAAVYGQFETELVQAIFIDEIGATDSDDWRVFMSFKARAYSTYQDHVLGKNQGPFWDNTTTKAVESKADILTLALTETWLALEDSLGENSNEWQWGQLLSYHFASDATNLKEFMPWWKRWVVGRLGNYTDVGPFPAGGSRNTLNVAGYDLGDDTKKHAYKVWNVPAMRLVVDFSLDEPVQLTIAGSQSGNPASPHYRDAHQMWVDAKTRTLVFQNPEKIKQVYSLKKTLMPKSQSQAD